MITKLLKKITNRKQRYDFHKIGYHGDKHLLKVVDYFIKDCDYFIETGSNVGTTLYYTANKYPNLSCLSCEPDEQAFNEAVKNNSELPNVKLYKMLSQNFLNIIENEYSDSFDKKTFFWLDAHGYGFEWPLKDEIAFVTEHYKNPLILIDDFKIPGREMFGYDDYGEQICSHDFIRNSIKADDLDLFNPAYTEHTSSHHPLRGWGLYLKKGSYHIPENLSNLMQLVK